MDYFVPCIKGKIKNRSAVVRVPGSKSITARALLLATLANGTSVLKGVQDSDDCATFLSAVRSLGIKVREYSDTVEIEGCGGELPVKDGEIYVGSAGTAARFLTALCAMSKGKYLIDASSQMKKRPQKPLIQALESVGAKFKFLGEQYCFPFEVYGAKYQNGAPVCAVSVDIQKSSQYLSALLISCVCLDDKFNIDVVGNHGLDYVNMTVEMMQTFGVKVERKGLRYTVCGSYKATDYQIEPDVSGACYFYAINKVLNTDVKVQAMPSCSLQGDCKFINLLKDFDGGEVDMSSFSDQALTLSAIAPYFSKPTKIVGVAHIRGQECDRIKAIVTNLTALGVKVEELEDGVIIYPSKVKGAKINTFGDHRVAMSFAVTGLVSEGVIIENAEVCSKTFKDYFTVLGRLIDNLT